MHINQITAGTTGQLQSMTYTVSMTAAFFPPIYNAYEGLYSSAWKERTFTG